MRWLEHHTIHWFKWWFIWSLCYENLIGVRFSLDSSMKFLIEISWISNGNRTHPSDFHGIKLHVNHTTSTSDYQILVGPMNSYYFLMYFYVCLIFYKNL